MARDLAMSEHIGQKIRARREELGMSQEGLGDALGVSFQQIQKYETGKNRVSAPTLLHLTEALEAPLDYFYPRKPEHPMPNPTKRQLGLIADALKQLGEALAALLEQVEELKSRN